RRWSATSRRCTGTACGPPSSRTTDVGTTTFERVDGAVTLIVDKGEVPVLRDLFEQLVALLDVAESPDDEDPLSAMVGIGTSTKAPEDPALARLLPSAYRD